MKRLTKRLDNGEAVYYLSGFGAFDEITALSECVDRLAAYEDTGFEPKEIEEAKNKVDAQFVLWLRKAWNLPDGRINEILRAEKDGRLVILPCKVGDIVFVDVRTFPRNYLHPADGCRDYARCEIVSIVTTKKGTYIKLRALYPSRASRREYLRYGVTAIGKTVFLACEEAEAALKKRERVCKVESV